VCRWRLTPWRRQDKAMFRAGMMCGGRFVVQALRNLWVLDVVLGTEICIGVPRDETCEVTRTGSTSLCTVN